MQGNARFLRTVNIPAYRGMITDRNGQPLAISTPVDSVWIDPQAFKPSQTQLVALADLLTMRHEDIVTRSQRAANREFVYLMRGINPYIANRVKMLNIPGVYLQREFRRFYPEGVATAHLLGFTNIDDEGQEGLELAYNDWLRGVPGKRRVIKDRYGQVVADLGTVKNSRSGHNLMLSIDRRIQYLAYRELEQAVQKFKAAAGSVIVLDVKTGSVLADANYPAFNPNQRPIVHKEGNVRNRALTDVFEPGSVIKAFSVASALEAGGYKPNTLIDTHPMIVDGNKIQDVHAPGVITVAEVIKHSSNVGVSKMTLSFPPSQLVNFLKRVGFGETTGSGFPGEREGTITEYRVWPPFALATLSFGYGISATPLQLARAYAVIANHGIKQPVSFLQDEKPRTQERVLSEALSTQMLGMLEQVVQKDASGYAAMIPGYRVAGKTGTSRMLGQHGYEKSRHIASFAGIAPVSDPQLVVMVVIHDPQDRAYYASQVAAPVFAAIMGGALSLLNIPPDNLPNTSAISDINKPKINL